MTILILTINYSPEPTGFAPHATAIAEHFAAAGHAVSVLTGFPFAPYWKRWAPFRGQFRETSTANGVLLTRLTHFIPRRPSSMIQRVLMEGTFCLSVFWQLVSRRGTLSDPDAILYIGAQPALALLARVLSWWFAAPYFVDINDLATDAARDVGIVKNRALANVLASVETAAYTQAAGAMVLSPRFSAWLTRRGYSDSKIRIIPSPIDLANVRPVDRTNAFRQKLGIPADAYVVLTAGSMGVKQGLSNVIEAAANAREIAWVLVGDGESRRQVEEHIAFRRLEGTVHLVSFQPESELAAMFADADALLLNQLAEVKDAVVPSKLLTYMAAGRPIVAAVNRTSEAARLLNSATGGVLVTPEDPAALAAAARQLVSRDRQELDLMGSRNRAYAEAHFDARKVLQAHEDFITQSLSGVAMKPAH